MKKHNTETQEFEALLKKIDKVNDIATSIKEQALENKNTGVKFHFDGKHIKDEELDLRHKLVSFKEWDVDLYNMLDVKIAFTHKIGTWKMGDYNGSRIRMSRNHSHSKWDTYVHEIGHAIQMQLGYKYIPNEHKYILELVKDLIEDLTGKNLRSSAFKSLKPYISKYISKYGAKNEREMFAEIYMFAYGDTDSQYKKDRCKMLMETYSKAIKEGIKAK